jgi:hypothetical protein
MYDDFSRLADLLPASGRIVIHCENGQIISYRILREDEHIATMQAFIELSKVAGYTVQTPNKKDV